MALNNKCLHFNPSSSQLSYATLGTSGNNPSIKNLGDFTWMAWVKSDGSRNRTLKQRLYVERTGQDLANTIRFGVVPSKDRLRFELTVKDGDNKTNYDYLFNWNQAWHHIAFVGKINGTTPTYEIYFDGTKVADGTLRKTSGVNAVSNTAPLHNTCFLGNVNYAKTGTTEYFLENQWYGKVDEIYVFKSALNQSFIQDYILNRNVLATSDPDMISYWDFEGTGTTETDKDNAGWVATLYKYELNTTPTAADIRNTDRPFIGVSGTGQGPLDTTPPTKPTLAAGYSASPTFDSFVMSINTPTDNVNVNTIEFQVAEEVNDFSSYVTYIVPFAFDDSTVLTLPIADLAPGTNFFWRARAIDEALNLSADWTSGEVQAVSTLQVTTIPRPPTSVEILNPDHQSFTVKITANATDVTNAPITVAGFKVDIAYDNKFSRFVSGWKNADVGNNTMVPVTGLSQLTTYFVRVRQYVADGTESVSGTFVVVQTSSAPDETPPLPVDAHDATSIDSRSATLNWAVGVDNVAVVDYLLDVSTNNTFTELIVDALSVGDVTSYRQTGLLPNTSYYYRVRAVDAAGLISNYSAVIGQFTTISAGIEDGGFVTVDSITIADTYVDSLTPTTVRGTETQMFAQGNGTTITRASYIQFDLTQIGSNPTATLLWLFNAQNTAPGGSVTIQCSNSLTINESTTHWNNQPAVGGTTVSVTLPGSDQWVSVDVSDFVTGPGVYLFKISTTANATYSFYTRDVTTGPGLGRAAYLAVEYDPSLQIKPDHLYVTDGPREYKNLCVNPNATSGVTTGWTATANTTLTIDATNGLNGGASFKNVIASAATNPIGMQTTTPIPVTTGDAIFVNAYVKSETADRTATITCQGLNGSSAVVSTTSLTGTAKPGGHTQIIGYYAVTDPSVVSVRITLGGTPSTAATLHFDNVVFQKVSVLTNPGLMFGLNPYFDGTTGGYDGFWTGTVNRSASTRYGASINLRATYLGDSNTNASAIPFLKRASDTDWISVYQSLIMYGDSVNNHFYTTLGPAIGPYNLLQNPSFEVNTNGWSSLAGAGSSVLTKNDEDAYVGNSCGKVVTNATANIGIRSHRVYLSSYADDYQHARVAFKAPSGHRVGVYIAVYNASNTLISTSTGVLGESELVGNDDWQEITVSFAMPVNAYSYEVQVLQVTAAAATWYVDAALAGDGAHVNPYRDGTFEDAYFEGTAHDSPTSLFLLPNEVYDVKVQFTDPDGIIGQSGTVADLTATFRTSAPLDYRTIINEVTHPIQIVTTSDRITFDLPYFGDDTGGVGQMSAVVEYKRTDLNTWQLTDHIVDRTAKIIHADILNLNPGTFYDVRLTLTDADGVSGLLNNVKQFSAATEYFGQNISTPSVITFGGYLLHDETRSNDLKTFVTKHDAFGFPERRLDIQDIPKTDGAIELDAFWGTRTINMSGIVFGNSRNEVIEAIDQMKIGLLGRQQPLVINTFSNNNRRYFATCKSLKIQEGEGNFRHLEWDATFECADPFAYSAETRTYGPVQVQLTGNQITLTNNGALETHPLITISTKSSSRITPSLLATLTSERIVPEKGMVTDDVLVIDCAAQSVMMNGTDIGYTGIFPTLYPGTNVWQFDAYRGPTQRNVYVTVQWRERFI